MNPDDYPMLIVCEWCERYRHPDDVYVSGTDTLCGACVIAKREARKYLAELDRLYAAPF